MTKTLSERFPKPEISKLSPEAQKAIQAANRSAEKLRAQKKALGQKLVVWEDGKVVTVDP